VLFGRPQSSPPAVAGVGAVLHGLVRKSINLDYNQYDSGEDR
jgi:hypothetical protein